MMRIQVTYVADDDMITDAIATLYAMGQKPTQASVKDLLRKWYERGGLSVEVESVDERNFVEDIPIEDNHWTLALLSPLRLKLSENGWQS